MAKPKYSLSDLDFSRLDNRPNWAIKANEDYSSEIEQAAQADIDNLQQQGVVLTQQEIEDIVNSHYAGKPYNLKRPGMLDPSRGKDLQNVVGDATTAENKPPEFSIENTLKYGVASTRAQNAQQDIADARVLEEGKGIGGAAGRMAQSAADDIGQPVNIPVMAPGSYNPLAPVEGLANAASGIAKKTLESVAGLSKFANDISDRVGALGDNPYEVTNNAFHRLTTDGMPLLPTHEDVVAKARRTIQERTPVAEQQSKIAANLAPSLPSKVKFATDVASSIVSTPEQILPTIGAVAGSFVEPGAGTVAGSVIGSVPIAKRVYNDSYLDARDNLHATEDEADKYATIVSAIQMGTETLGGPAEASVLKLAETMGLKKLTKEAARDWLLQKAKSRAGSLAASGGRALGAAAIEGTENLAGTIGQDILENNMDLSSPEGKAALHQRNAENTATRAERYVDSFEQGAAAGLALSGPISTIQAGVEQGQITADRRKRTDTLNSSIESEFQNQQEQNEQARKAEEQRAQEAANAAAKAREAKPRVRAVETIAGTQFESVAPQQGAPAGVRGPGSETAATGVPTEQRAEELSPFDAARKQIKEIQGEKPTKTQFAAMRELLKQNPQATQEELLAAAKTERPPIAEPKKTDKSQTEKDLDNLADQLGLGMAADNQSDKPVPADFKQKTKAIVKALVGKTTQQSSDIQSLIHQRKMVLAPNAESIGRKGTVGNKPSAAEYDPETGKMYVYTDNISNPSDINSILPAALHESVHGATRSDNNSRSAIYTTLLGKDGVSAAAGKLRVAAKNGNQLASNALAKAEADTEARNGDNQHENEELVAYFASEAAKARQGVLGTVGGVVKDIRSAARATVRDKLGLDLDFNINDLDTAAQGVAGELARSDTKTGKGDTLAMIYNKNSKGFKEALAAGHVYDSVDGRQKYVLSDADAKLKPGAKEKLHKARGSVKLGDILEHDILYKEHPELKDMPVNVMDTIPGTPEAFAQYDPNGPEINIARRLIDQPEGQSTPPLEGGLMHEIQHYVQDAGGYLTDETYVPTPEHEATKKEYVAKTAASDKAVRQMLDTVPAALRGELDAAGKRDLADILYDRDMKDYVKARHIALLASDYGIKLEGKPATDLEAYTSARAEQNAAAAKYQESNDKEQVRYFSNITEKEAFRTQNDINMGQYAINERGNPEPQMADQDVANFPETKGRIDVPEKQTLRKAAGQSSLGMAAEETGETESAFKKWFGKSKAVNEDGSPRRYYTGTSKDKNFTGFNVPKNGVWFTDDPKAASQYAVENDSMTARYEPGKGFQDVNTSSRIFPVYLRAENPYTITEADHAFLNKENYKRQQGILFDKLRAQGYDSVYLDPEGSTIAVLDSPTQIKSVFNENPTNKSKDVLGMASESKPARKVPSWFTSIFRNDKGLGKEINAAVEHAHSAAAGSVMKAESSLGNYEKALDRMAKSMDMTPRQLGQKIASELDAVDKESDSYDENLAKFKEVANKYGAAGEALIDLRNQVDDLSMELLRVRAASGVKLSPTELERYRAIRNNMGRYVHRMYAAYQGKAGNKYANTVWDAWEKAKKGKKLTAAQQENYQLVANAVRDLVDNSLAIPSDEVLENSTTEHLRRLASTWIPGDTSGLAKEDLISELSDRRDAVNGDKNRLNNMAEEIAHELLGLADATQPLVKYFRGQKLNTGILQERSNIPEPVRAMMGEITSPGIRLMATVGKQAEFIARSKLLLEMRSFVGTDLQPPTAMGTDIVVANGMKKLEGEGWGPLEGWFASDNMRNMLGDVVQQNATFEQAAAMASTKPDQLFNDTVQRVFRTWAKVAGISKMMQIVGKPSMFVVNAAGSFRQLLINGNVNPVTAAKAWKTSLELIAYSLNPRVSSEAARVVNTYGVTDSAFVGEMKNMNYRQIQQLVKEMATKKEPTTMTNLARTAAKVGLSWRETYAMMDVWAKIANFYNQVDVLKDFYEKNGDTKTDDEIYREAADNVNRTNITYKRAAPIIKVIERGGITQFGTYFYETFRSEIGNMAQAFYELQKAKEAKTPEARNAMIVMAGKRMTGQTLAWAATAYLSRALAQVAFGDDEDKEDKLRRLLPDYGRTADYIPIGKDADGKPVLVQFSMLDPVGPVTDFMRQALNGDADPAQMLKQFGQLYVAPRIVPQLAQAVVTTAGGAAPTRQPLLKQLTPSGYESLLDTTGTSTYKDKTLKAWLNVADTFLPGITNSWRNTNPHPVVDSPSSAVWSAMSYSGMTMYQLNPDSAVYNSARPYTDSLKTTRKDIANYFSDHPNATKENVIEVVADAKHEEFQNWQNMRDAYQGLQALGMSDADIAKAFKEQRVSGDVIHSLRTGTFKSSVISKESIDSYMQKDMKGKSGKEKAEIKDKWKTAWQLLNGADKEQE